ncbi:MAG: hypothetical protein OET55_10140, partial [Desulfuromonadales bacterium]|nr:hypothetical protein [Desulfuromonadales bacterium]
KNRRFFKRKVCTTAQLHKRALMPGVNVLTGFCQETPGFTPVRNKTTRLEAAVNISQALKFVVIILITPR